MTAVRIHETDVAIIGAGTAGMSAYRSVSRAGKKAILIESGPYGTTCARVGCMPSKLLIAAADAAHSARNAAPFGVNIPTVEVDGVQVLERLRRERDRFVGFALREIEAMPPADKLQGHARFLSDTRLMVGGQDEVRANAVVIATGSAAAMPGDFSHLGDRLVINDDVFEWHDFPRRVLVVGTGVIGLELGQALARLGVQVCLINHSDSLAGLRDPVVHASALRAFSDELDIHSHTSLVQAWREEEGVRVELRTEAPGTAPQTRFEQVDYVLMAAGRRPRLDGLGLENTQIPRDERGHPIVDPLSLQLGSTPVFIAGDVRAHIPVLHEATDDGWIAGRNAASYPEAGAAQRRTPLVIVFSDPQLAHVGESFPTLDPDRIVIGELDFTSQGRSRIMLKNRGYLRVYAGRPDGRLLGAEMAGPQVEHIAHLLAWACQQQLTLDQMMEMPFYHPVIEEGVRTALRDALRQLRAA